jgi:GNAT superfamily N-acetyltransferase
MTDTVGFEIDVLQPGDVAACAGMTFPAYRHLLALQPTTRLPSEPEQRDIQPVALVARASGQAPPIGLAVAELPVRAADGAAELLSLLVAADYRRQGVATALVEAMEETLRAGGAAAVEAVYTTGKPAIDAVERIFEKRGWDAPELRTMTVRFTIAEALATPWYGRMGLLPAGAEIFSWKDITAAERQQLRESNARAPWIANSLQPWRHDHLGFDPISSVGLRYRGEVVGWVINHQIDPRTVRFTCSFMRKDLSRRARIVPLYSEALRRLSETSCEFCTLVTPTVYPGMLEFLRRHCSPYASFTGETRGARKSLTTSPADVP